MIHFFEKNNQAVATGKFATDKQTPVGRPTHDNTMCITHEIYTKIVSKKYLKLYVYDLSLSKARIQPAYNNFIWQKPVIAFCEMWPS